MARKKVKEMVKKKGIWKDVQQAVPTLEYVGEVWEGNAKYVWQSEPLQMTAATKILTCSRKTSDAVLRATLGMYPLKSNRNMTKLK